MPKTRYICIPTARYICIPTAALKARRDAAAFHPALMPTAGTATFRRKMVKAAPGP